MTALWKVTSMTVQSGTVQSGDNPVIVFDGVCVLCSRWVGFLLKRDRGGFFRFAAMQGEAGRALLERAGLDPDDPSSFILVEENTIRKQTDAIAAVLTRLNRPWPAIGALMLLCPRPVRDWLYFRVARNRYRLFGRKEACYLPAPEEQARFLT